MSIYQTIPTNELSFTTRETATLSHTTRHTLRLISANLASDACFNTYSCLFCLINLSATLTFIFFLLSFLDCLFLNTPDEKLVISGNLDPSIFPMTKSCAGSSMHNASVLPLKKWTININTGHRTFLLIIVSKSHTRLLI